MAPLWLNILYWLLRHCWQFLLGIVVVVAVLVWWRNHVNPPPDPGLKNYRAVVDTVKTGDRLLVYRRGRIGLKTISLAYCVAPAADQVYSDESRVALQQRLPKGTQVEVEEVKTVGQIVWTADRMNVNMQQLRDGACWCGPGAPSAWVVVEREARKAGRGLWQYYADRNVVKKLRVIPEGE